LPERPTVAGEQPALFLPDSGDRFIPTIHTQGPWSPDLQFGGAAAALLAVAVERAPTLVPMRVARLTVDLLRPVPIAPLRAVHRIVREGKRIQVVEAALHHEDVEVARAVGLRFRLADLGDLAAALPAGPPAPLPPATVPDPPRRAVQDGYVPGISRAVEMRVGDGRSAAFDSPTWVRLRVPVLAGEDPAGPGATGSVAPLALVADFVSGFGHPDRTLPLTGINADISLHVVRPPSGEWLCLAGTGWTAAAGIGHAQATISDGDGVAATATLSRLVDRM
jgi:hypothetical protein